MKNQPRHKLHRALGLPTFKERQAAKKRSSLAELPTFVEDTSTLDYIGSCFPNVMKAVPQQDTYAQKVMGYPSSHQQARCGESESWAFERPEE